MHLSFSPFLSPVRSRNAHWRVQPSAFRPEGGRCVPRELSRRSGNLNRSAQKSASITCGKSFGFLAPGSRECFSANGESCERAIINCEKLRRRTNDVLHGHFNDSSMSLKSVSSWRQKSEITLLIKMFRSSCFGNGEM